VQVELALYDHFFEPDVEAARAFYAGLRRTISSASPCG